MSQSADQSVEATSDKQVELWMQALAAHPLDAPPLPDPQLLWWKAQSLRRIDRERRAQAALEKADRIPIAVSIAITALLLMYWLYASEAVVKSTVTFIALGSVVVGVGALIASRLFRNFARKVSEEGL